MNYNETVFIHSGVRMKPNHESIHGLEMEMKKIVDKFGYIISNMKKAMYSNEYTIQVNRDTRFIFSFDKSKEGYKITRIRMESGKVLYYET